MPLKSDFVGNPRSTKGWQACVIAQALAVALPAELQWYGLKDSRAAAI